MSGHSRWSQIKHKKAIADAKKGAVFGKLARAISIAARGNPDPATNLRLRGEIERARAVNMPNENIQRAIARVNDAAAAALSEIQIELIGPGNAAVIVSAITDNSNRTIGELKRIATAHGARMAGMGSVAWLFRKMGVISLTPSAPPDVQLNAIDAGAEDVITDDHGSTVLTAPERLGPVTEALGDAVASSGVELIPSSPLTITDPGTATSLTALLEALDEHDDVQQVTTNAVTP